MGNNSYLLVPSCVDGNGTGHLRRIIDLYNNIKKKYAVIVYIPLKQISVLHKNILNENIERDNLIFNQLPENLSYKFIIVDYRESPVSLLNSLEGKGFLVGIDEGGNHRRRFDYLIDIIPSKGYSVKANYSSVGLMNLPERRKYLNNVKFRKILISFGGEDYSSLTKNLLDFFKINGYFNTSEFTVVGKNSFDRSVYKNSISFIDSIDNLKSIICQFDLVFTSFGFTAFESLAAGVPFLLLNPSFYHYQLSKECKFVEIGVTKPVKSKLERFLLKSEEFGILQKKYIPETYTNLGDFILALKNVEKGCPVCHCKGSPGNIIYRFRNRNFYKCQECGIVYQVYFKQIKNSYRKDYFFDDYKNQYGRTYLEDFKNIQQLAVPRLRIISKSKSLKKLKKQSRSDLELLDVGCAYGPFLLEAKNIGFKPTGVEIISDAAKYVRSKFGFSIYSGSFENIESEKKYDTITMWYVIEHFADLKLILTKVNMQLKLGGIFAFATPNSAGISAVKDKNSFFKNSPIDHITVWNPKISNKILNRFGFKIRKIRITGHHPERFSSNPLFKTKLGYILFIIISKIFGLGDTFEIYAEKMKEFND